MYLPKQMIDFLSGDIPESLCKKVSAIVKKDAAEQHLKELGLTGFLVDSKENFLSIKTDTMSAMKYALNKMPIVIVGKIRLINTIRQKPVFRVEYSTSKESICERVWVEIPAECFPDGTFVWGTRNIDRQIEGHYFSGQRIPKETTCLMFANGNMKYTAGNMECCDDQEISKIVNFILK